METVRTLKRDLQLMLLKANVDQINNQGGVIALVGSSGYGKSIVAQQFMETSGSNTTLYERDYQGDQSTIKHLPVLSGLSVIDDAFRFPNIGEALRTHVKQRGVAIAVFNSQEEAILYCGDLVTASVTVPYWRALN